MFWTILLTCIIIYVFLSRWLRSLKIKNYGDKYVFITGCDGGFGRELAIRLDGLAFHVFAGCLTKKGCEDLVQLCSQKLVTLTLDVTDDGSIRQALELVKEKLPSDTGLWAVVNNAGMGGITANIEMLTKEEFINTLDINLYGPIEITRTFLPLVRKAQGRIVNMTSIMGRIAAVNAPYCMSKFGLEAYSDILRRELYRHGVKVCILEPGFFRTNILNVSVIKDQIQKSYERSSAEVKKAYGTDFVDRSAAMILNLLAKFASDDTRVVVNAYTDAITSKYPHSRYVLGNDAKFIFIPMTYFPDWFTDWLFRFQFNRALKQEMLSKKYL